MATPRTLLIVGGGTAGWLTAAFLAQTLGTARGGPRITVVESPEIGIIGVGEGSFPSLRGTLSLLGMSEAEFIRDADATFKQGVLFQGWATGRDSYFHPFNAPSQRPGAPELLPYWLLGVAGTRSYAEAASMQTRLVAARRGPKRLDDADWRGPMNYAYHFDAARLAEVLARRARALGVEHRTATIEHVQLDEHGAIAALHAQDGRQFSADLYVDCTGQRATLIGQALASPRRALGDVLFVDRAVALQVPHAQPDAALASATISTAQEAGWTWDIGLQQRRGVGYVYSSRHSDAARAEQVLRRHVGPAAAGLPTRSLKLDNG